MIKELQKKFLLDHRIETRLVPRSHIYPGPRLFGLLQQKAMGLQRELPMTSERRKSHGGFPTAIIATSLAHQQVVHIPRSLQTQNKCLSLKEHSRLKVHFQISRFHKLQKCIIDSAQNKPANLPFLQRHTEFRDQSGLSIFQPSHK